ncbi:hypothetical protein QR680_004643 [Steinernema hermaphroditum]|uniref:Uncharacterized protein n=1 Tax=Steinernema hermaphroditum TaxID=289476 RepID=A0AA39LU01_9BILA|nr:hypothetical protein QR680_004643 [Steinernema hermaphroditum]
MEPTLIFVIAGPIIFLTCIVICALCSWMGCCPEDCHESHCHIDHCDRPVYVVQTDCERGPSNPCWTSCERPHHCC